MTQGRLSPYFPYLSGSHIYTLAFPCWSWWQHSGIKTRHIVVTFEHFLWEKEHFPSISFGHRMSRYHGAISIAPNRQFIDCQYCGSVNNSKEPPFHIIIPTRRYSTPVLVARRTDSMHSISPTSISNVVSEDLMGRFWLKTMSICLLSR